MPTSRPEELGAASRTRSVSTLRARCPDCRTLTAVAIDTEYQCHSCGREYAAGLVRVPRAWGVGGEAMAAAASLALPYPEAAVIEEESLEDQVAAQIRNLPALPLVLGGCCCAHSAQSVVSPRGPADSGSIWIDAHGDLNTPESSPSGNEWGMPLRMAIDAGAVSPEDVALVGARSLDPPEVAVHGGGRESTRTSSARSTGATASTLPSTATSCDPASSRSSCRSRVGRPWPRPKRCSRASSVACTLAGFGLTGLTRRRGSRRRRATRGCGRTVTV